MKFVTIIVLLLVLTCSINSNLRREEEREFRSIVSVAKSALKKVASKVEALKNKVSREEEEELKGVMSMLKKAGSALAKGVQKVGTAVVAGAKKAGDLALQGGALALGAAAQLAKGRREEELEELVPKIKTAENILKDVKDKIVDMKKKGSREEEHQSKGILSSLKKAAGAVANVANKAKDLVVKGVKAAGTAIKNVKLADVASALIQGRRMRQAFPAKKDEKKAAREEESDEDEREERNGESHEE
jgi:hypothetical protein